MKIPVHTTLWNFVPMMFVMLNECIQGLRLIHEVYTLFQDRRRETEPQGSLEMEQNSSNQFQILSYSNSILAFQELCRHIFC